MDEKTKPSGPPLPSDSSVAETADGATVVSEALEQVTGARPATDEELEEQTGGLNLVYRASCSTSKGSMNTVVSVGTV